MECLRNFNNQFLIATPGMAGNFFAKSVTLIYHHDENGAMGITINHPSKYELGDILTQMDIDCEDDTINQQKVLSGGPVQPERGFVLHTGKPGWDASFPVSDDWSVTTSRDILQAMAIGKGPENTVVALGFAGWGGGQLEEEIKQNAWLTVAADKHIVFNTPVNERWNQAARLVGVDITQMASYGGHA